MNKFKAGQSIVIDILDISDDGYYKLGNENRSWWSTYTSMDEMAEPLTDYTMPLINKIERQAKSITSLLKQNSDLKRENEELKNKVRNMEDTFNTFMTSMCDACEHIDSVEKARVAGKNDAWELAGKLLDMDYADFKKIFGITSIKNIINQGYTEVAAKVEEWERQEICVGDVVECEEHYGVVVGVGGVYVKGFTSDWTPFQWMKRSCTKTGRHIDVNAWLEQIGGGSDE